MGSIVPFLHGVAFDPEATDAMSAAYDKAVALLRDKGQPAVVNEVIAKRIIALARRGERNPDILCERALAGIGAPVDRAC